MASEATWQTGGAYRTGAASTDSPMDQRTVESLLRRLVERVEESERRYSEALDELHARLDQLSQTTDAVRATSTPEGSATLDRLHDQMNSLARRFEPQSTNPLDDFERLGKELSANLDFAAGGSDGLSGAADVPSAFPSAPTPLGPQEPPSLGLPDFGFKASDFPFSASSFDLSPPFDKRLTDVAHQLEHSLGTVMPAATIEAMNTRLDEIANQLSEALRQAPKLDNLASVEKQLSEMGQQLSRAEAQLARMTGIEDQLRTLIERFDAAPDVLEEIATKAASEAARLVAGNIPSGASEERIDAMHRDLVAMSDKSRASDERLAGTLQAVHDSLKQLVQQVEKSAAAALQPPKPQAPFAERVRAGAQQGLPPSTLPPVQQPMGPHASFAEGRIEKGATGNGAEEDMGTSEKEKSLRSRLVGSLADLRGSEPTPPFGRGKRGPHEEEAVDLDAPAQRRQRIGSGTEAEFAQDDLVAAARRAAQAAALRAEERAGGGKARRSSVTIAPGSIPDPDAASKRKRSLLMISAAVLLVISAALLYGRLRSKPEVETTPPAAEQSVPNPAGDDQITPLPEGSRHGTAVPGDSQSAPVPVEPSPNAAPPVKSGAWEVQPGDVEQEPADGAATGFNQGIDPSPDDSAPSDTSQAGGVTDVAKSSYRRAPVEADDMPRAQPASFAPEGAVALPPGVSVSIEEPTLGASTQGATPATLSMPTKLPLPPEALGPISLRQAAASGDPRAQYAVALRYAQGEDVSQDLTEAAHWLERAAAAGLAPAQYRLAAMYERGQGVSRDLGKARSWYAAAAEKGNIKAMHNLAVSASGAQGDKADYGLAAKWYSEAAAYGLADSQYNLGILAEHGLGTTKNLGAAYQWFALAATNGDTEAAKRRDLVKVQLDPQTLAAAEQAVKSWKAKPAISEANEVALPTEWTASTETPTVSLVTRAQKLLNKLGYDAGPPNGQLDNQTRDAIKSFERRNGLDETGEVNIPLVTKLERLTS
jgi:localization factor PodJL